MRFSWEPLEARLKITEVDGEMCTSRRLQALKLGVTARQVKRWVNIGLDLWQADRASIAVGVVPYEVWPEWLVESFRMNTALDQAGDEGVWNECELCGGAFSSPQPNRRYCGIKCRNKAARQRQYDRNAEQERAATRTRKAALRALRDGGDAA